MRTEMGEPMVLPWRTPETKWARVALDAHAPAASVALLPPPKLAVDELLIDFNAGRNAGDNRNQGFSVRLTGGAETQHKALILQ